MLDRLMSALWRTLFPEPARPATEAQPDPDDDTQERVVWSEPSSARAVIFLDFDGVLHPGFSETFCHMDAFAEVLRGFPHVDVVISSSWRQSTRPGDLLSLFPKDLHDRICGITPSMSGPFARHREICEFAGRWGLRRWVALDDDPTLFPTDCDYLLLMRSCDGLDATNIERLRARLMSIA